MIPTPLSTLAVTRGYQIPPYQSEVNLLSMAVQSNQINKSEQMLRNRGGGAEG